MAQSWFIMRGESRLGPFTHHGLITLASNGGLSPQDMVWCTDLPAPIPAVGVAGLFPEPEPEPAPEPEFEVEIPPIPTRPQVSTPSRFSPPAPRPAAPTPSEEEFSFAAPRRRKDRFAALFEDGGDTVDEAEVDEEEAPYSEPAIPVVRRPARRVAPARRAADNSGLLIGLGGFSLLAVIMLIVVLEQGQAVQSKPQPASRPPTPPRRTAPRNPEAPAAVQRPEPTPPRPPTPPPPPRFDKQPLIDEMAKGTVDAMYQANPSLKTRYRELWESQLQTLLTQETKGMREEQQIREAAKRVCDEWAVETQKFVTNEAAPPPPPDAIDGASQTGTDPDAPVNPDAPPVEPEAEP